MPHIIIEVSDDKLICHPEQLLASINQSLWQSNHFKQPTEIKTRLYTAAHALSGVAADDHQAFIMVHFYLLAGRDDATIRHLNQTIAQIIHQHMAVIESYHSKAKLQICVNSTELSNNYVKQLF